MFTIFVGNIFTIKPNKLTFTIVRFSKALNNSICLQFIFLSFFLEYYFINERTSLAVKRGRGIKGIYPTRDFFVAMCYF